MSVTGEPVPLIPVTVPGELSDVDAQTLDLFSLPLGWGPARQRLTRVQGAELLEGRGQAELLVGTSQDSWDRQWG